MKILYIVSTLRRTGPTNQLFSLIKYLKLKKEDITVLTLSPEPYDSRWEDFEALGINLVTLNTSRIKGLLQGVSQLKSFLKNEIYDIVHTQGIRPDIMMSKLDSSNVWVTTCRNNPFLDYRMKYGKIVGYVSAWYHRRSLLRCKRVVACSYSIKNELVQLGIKSIAIQNGVDINYIHKFEKMNLGAVNYPIFISVGSLIERKNMDIVLNAFNTYRELHKGVLLILGDGPLRKNLERIAHEDVIFTGKVANVPSYLKAADVFISASKAEGLPNTVLEAMACGTKLILSNIPSHVEVFDKSSNICKLFKLDYTSADKIAELMSNIDIYDNQRSAVSDIVKRNFSAENMANKYFEYYKSQM